MGKDEILKTLKGQLDKLHSFKVKSLSLFGSFSKEEGLPSSDVDLLVEFSEPVGLFHFARLQKFLEDLLSRRVDLVSKDALKPQLKEKILKEAIRAT